MNTVNPVGSDRRAGPCRGVFDAATTRLPDNPPPEEAHDAGGGVMRGGATLNEVAPTILWPSVRGSSMSSRRRCRRMADGPSALRHWMTAAVCGMVLCLLLSTGCSGRQEADAAARSESSPHPSQASNEEQAPETSRTSRETFSAPPHAPMRREFVILRELLKQHAKQTEVGNAERLAIVDRNLRERLVALPDEGQTEDEREVLREATQQAVESLRRTVEFAAIRESHLAVRFSVTSVAVSSPLTSGQGPVPRPLAAGRQRPFR